MGINYTTPSIVTDGIYLCLDAGNPLSWSPDSSTGTVSYAQTTYTTAGYYEFIVPESVTQISAVCIGGGGAGGAAAVSRPGGGGGGGGLAYGTITVTPDEDLELRVGNAGVGEDDIGGDGGPSWISRSGTTLLWGGWGKGGDTGTELYPMLAEGGSKSGTDLDGGGIGGDGGSSGGMGGGWQGGAGGAGGYSGNGGNGYDGQSGTGSDGAGGGGGGGGGSGGDGPTGAGGGVGLKGRNWDGEGGNNTDGSAGSGGSGQTYGGGGGGAAKNTDDNGEDGGGGAIRIVYSTPTDAARVYPGDGGDPTYGNNIALKDTIYTTGASKWNGMINNKTASLNGVTWSNDAFSFDGTYDYINANTALPSSFWQGNYTVSVWIYFNTIAGDGDNSKIIFEHGDSNSYEGLDIQQKSSKVALALWSTELISASTVSASTWYNLTFTLNNTTKACQIYINGSLDASSTLASSYVGTGDNCKIGGQVYALGLDHLDGKLKQVLCYDRVLTAAEILKNYNITKTRFRL